MTSSCQSLNFLQFCKNEQIFFKVSWYSVIFVCITMAEPPCSCKKGTPRYVIVWNCRESEKYSRIDLECASAYLDLFVIEGSNNRLTLSKIRNLPSAVRSSNFNYFSGTPLQLIRLLFTLTFSSFIGKPKINLQSDTSFGKSPSGYILVHFGECVWQLLLELHQFDQSRDPWRQKTWDICFYVLFKKTVIRICCKLIWLCRCIENVSISL